MTIYSFVTIFPYIQLKTNEPNNIVFFSKYFFLYLFFLFFFFSYSSSKEERNFRMRRGWIVVSIFQKLTSPFALFARAGSLISRRGLIFNNEIRQRLGQYSLAADQGMDENASTRDVPDGFLFFRNARSVRMRLIDGEIFVHSRVFRIERREEIYVIRGIFCQFCTNT